MRTIGIYILVVFTLLLTSCSSLNMVNYSERYDQLEPLDAVLDIRKAMKAEGSDVQLKSLLVQYEEKAADYYYQRGLDRLNEQDYEAAIDEFNRGLTAYPDHDKLIQSISLAIENQQKEMLFTEAYRQYQVGNLQEAHTLLTRLANGKLPGTESDETVDLLQRINTEILARQNTLDVFSDAQKITLNFQNTPVKAAFGFLSKVFDLNIVFDESVKDLPVTLYAKDVTFKQGLALLLTSTKMFYQKIGSKTILVATDTNAKRSQYEELLIRTFQLRTMGAKEMADIVKGVLKVNKIVVNEQLNTLIVRDTQSIISLVDKMIEVNDRKPAELLLEVEILEINRNKAEQLGIDYGSVMTSVSEESSLNLKKILNTLEAGTVTLPNVTFRYFKQDVDAETLANPKIRVLNKKQAQIHIGDRVPLRSSTIQNANGQTQTSYEYSDIGIRLDVTPTIHFDDTITVQLTLEVSSLGQNLGSPEEPTYSIGTRNTSTFMLLKDGETAMIGGLIREEERNNTAKVPGLGSIPVLGRLFQTKDDSVGRTDVLLTITPKIVRRWDSPPKQLQSFYSGTAERYNTEPFYLDDLDSVGDVNLSISQQYSASANVDGSQPVNDSRSGEQSNESVLMEFHQGVFNQSVDEEFQVSASISGLNDIKTAHIPVVFNTSVLSLKSIEHSRSDIASINTEENEKGVNLLIEFLPEIQSGDESFFVLTFVGEDRGISYLNAEQPVFVDSNGSEHEIKVSSARVVIQ